MTPIVRFVKLTTPPELEQAIGRGIADCGADGEHLARLHAAYAQAVDEAWPGAAVYERLHVYRTAVIESRRRREETNSNRDGAAFSRRAEPELNKQIGAEVLRLFGCRSGQA